MQLSVIWKAFCLRSTDLVCCFCFEDGILAVTPYPFILNYTLIRRTLHVEHVFGFFQCDEIILERHVHCAEYLTTCLLSMLHTFWEGITLRVTRVAQFSKNGLGLNVFYYLQMALDLHQTKDRNNLTFFNKYLIVVNAGRFHEAAELM